MTLSSLNIESLANEYKSKSPLEIIQAAFEKTGEIAISFSGAEDVVLIDMATKVSNHVSVFSLDTGRLHPETYQFLETVRNHYGIDIEILVPQHELLQKLVQEKGLYSFMHDGHKECCTIRKVEPLRRKLANLDAWLTGQRRDQSVDTRDHLPTVQWDPAFSRPERQLLKYNPLANWTSAQVWQYIRENDVPFNPLHQQGFVSIGCEPCTRPVLPNQHEREGRWWWEASAEKECGLHTVDQKKNA